MLPPGPERDEMLGLVRLGARFKAQQAGRRRGHLHKYIVDIVSGMKLPVSFDRLLDELELAAARRELQGAAASPIEKVDRVFDLVTHHNPRAGRRQITFGRLRNIFTIAKRERFPPSAKA